MKYCSSCGTQLKDETEICPNCGKVQSARKAAAAAQEKGAAPLKTGTLPGGQKPAISTVLPAEHLPSAGAAGAEVQEERRRRFRMIGIPALAYAAVTAFLLYRSFSGIAMTAEAAAAAVFAAVTVKRTGQSLCRGSRPVLTAILLLGLSDFLTGNKTIQFWNGIGIFFLLLLFMVLNFRKPAGDSLWENISELFYAPLCGILRLNSPFSDAAACIRAEKNGWKKLVFPVAAGIAAGIPIMILILSLLCSADAVFRKVSSDFLDSFSWDPLKIIFSALLIFTAVYSILRALQEKEPEKKSRDCGRDPVIGITICIPVALVYLVFSTIQILFLFLRKMELPEGYSYAEYVHEGYWQLLAACLINLILTVFIKEFFRKSRILNILLTVIGGCTYIMTASAALRMVMYIRAFGLTFLRVTVLWTLAVIATLFAGVLFRIWKEKFFLFRWILVTVCSAWLLLSFAQPDRFIAYYNLYRSGVQTDFAYLEELSTDAAPVLCKYAREGGFYDAENRQDDRWRWFRCYESRCSRSGDEQNWRQTSLSGLYYNARFRENTF